MKAHKRLVSIVSLCAALASPLAAAQGLGLGPRGTGIGMDAASDAKSEKEIDARKREQGAHGSQAHRKGHRFNRPASAPEATGGASQ